MVISCFASFSDYILIQRIAALPYRCFEGSRSGICKGGRRAWDDRDAAELAATYRGVWLGKQQQTFHRHPGGENGRGRSCLAQSDFTPSPVWGMEQETLANAVGGFSHPRRAIAGQRPISEFRPSHGQTGSYCSPRLNS